MRQGSLIFFNARTKRKIHGKHCFKRRHPSLVHFFFLPIHLIMTPDVEKNHFLFGNQQGQSDAIAACEAGRVAIGKDADQGVEFKMGMEEVLLQVSQHLAEARLQIGMFFKNFRACRRNCH